VIVFIQRGLVGMTVRYKPFDLVKDSIRQRCHVEENAIEPRVRKHHVIDLTYLQDLCVFGFTELCDFLQQAFAAGTDILGIC
jgi:hypothetical protein